MKHLIINADDFGLHETVNAGIIEGHTAGIITSTTIMPSGRAFEHAVSLAKMHQTLGVGVHLTLVGEKPVCPPEKVPSLVDRDGCLSSQYPQFLKGYVLGNIQLSDIRRELTAQVQKVVASGLSITHLDSHQHMHIVPGIIDVTIEIAKEFNIKSVRIPAEPYFFFGGYPCPPMRFIARAGLTMLSQLAGQKIRKNKLTMPEHFFGMLAGGNMQEEFLLEILKVLPEGRSEIMMHPGSNNQILNQMYPWNYHGQEELAAVTSAAVRQYIKENEINLISFRNL